MMKNKNVFRSGTRSIVYRVFLSSGWYKHLFDVRYVLFESLVC